LCITGRKKDMIVTAAGKNIAPQRIENIMSDSRYISHFMVYGDGKKFLTGLITLNKEEIKNYLQAMGFEARQNENFSERIEIYALVKRHIEEKNALLARFETIKRFAIVDDDFTIIGGELTPTLKMRRQYISDKYQDVLDTLYKS